MSEVEVIFNGEHMAQISINLPEDALQAPIQEFLKEKRKVAVLKGFRKGKAPLKMVAQLYSTEARQAATDRMLQTSYFKALQEHKLRALTQPTVHNLVDEGQTIKCELSVEVLKPIVLQQYLGLELTKTKKDALEPLIEQNVARLKTITPKITPVADTEALAQNGQVVNIDFVGELEGKVFEDTKDYRLKLGSHMFVDGFEDQVVGMKAGENKVIKVTFPPDYKAELAGKEATFTVKVNQINTVSDPSNDELAAGLGVESYDKLVEKITQELKEKQDDETRLELENQIIDKLLSSHDFSVPVRLITAEVMHVKQQNPLLSEDEVIETAKKYVKTDIILGSIYERHPDIHLTQEYVGNKLAELGMKSGKGVEKVVEDLTNKGLMDQYINFLKNSRVVDYVVEMADVSEVEQKKAEEYK